MKDAGKWLELETHILCEGTKSQTDEHCMLCFICRHWLCALDLSVSLRMATGVTQLVRGQGRRALRGYKGMKGKLQRED